MPKRVIDFDAMWGSDKLAACAEWAQAEYAWLYGLADASGCFELTNLRVIWGRVAAVRRNLSIERLEQIFEEFQDKGLLFAWDHEGKRYGHWTGSDVPGRLPPPSWRMRLERLAPPVPKQALAEYVSRFARGRAGLPGGGFLAEGRAGENAGGRGSSDLGGAWRQGKGNLKSEISDLKDETQSRLTEGNDWVEVDQGQDWNWNGDLNREGRRNRNLSAGADSATASKLEREKIQSGGRTLFSPSLLSPNSNSQSNMNSKSRSASQSCLGSNSISDTRSKSDSSSDLRSNAGTRSNSEIAFGTGEVVAENSGKQAGENHFTVERSGVNCSGSSESGDIAEVNSGNCAVAGRASHGFRRRDKAEILVGQGPVCGPVRIKPEALERIRQRNAARDGSCSP